MQDISTFNPFVKPVRVIRHPEQYRAAGIDIWRSCYDAELPANLLEMCHPDKCDLCGVPFSKPIVAKTHYVGKMHCQKTAKFLGKGAINECTYKRKYVCSYTCYITYFVFIFQRFGAT